jgi:hypothetical protein
MAKATGDIEVFIESGNRRVFASALDWPGWARSAKTEALAVEAMADYLQRYAEIVRLADGEMLYARKMGVSLTKEERARPGAQGRLHGLLAGALRDPHGLVTPPKGWPPRYAARRFGWHVLDHLWEIEDKSEPV